MTQFLNARNDVAKFMVACDQQVSTVPGSYIEDQAKLYKNLVIEEIEETLSAFERNDLVEVADGIADAIWVLLGLAHTMGIPIQNVWDEVSRSNMSKISESGKVIKREDGKVMKPDTFVRANVKRVVEEYAHFQSVQNLGTTVLNSGA